MTDYISRKQFHDSEGVEDWRILGDGACALALLRPLPKAAWSRCATVTGAGRPRERTVLDYARWLANHERSHVKHSARIVSG